MNDQKYSEEEIFNRLNNLLPKLQNKVDTWYEKTMRPDKIIIGKTFLQESPPPELQIEKTGRKYWKIVRVNRGDFGGVSKSVHAFVRKSDGAVFKAATWRRPQTETKSAIRGYITDEFPEDYFTPFGVIYAI